jgi:hypothetical protein
LDKTLITALVAIAVVVAAFLGGHFSKDCPEASNTLVEALTAQVEEKEKEAQNWRTLADKYKATADSIASIPKPDVDKVLPTIPVGRSDAGLDSLRAILLRKP